MQRGTNCDREVTAISNDGLFFFFFFSFRPQFGGVLTVVMSKEKKGLALVEFSNAQAAVSIFTRRHCHQFRCLLSTYWLITRLPVNCLL